MAQMQVLTLEVDEDPAFAMVVGGFFGVEDEVCCFDSTCRWVSILLDVGSLSGLKELHLHNGSGGQSHNLALIYVPNVYSGRCFQVVSFSNNTVAVTRARLGTDASAHPAGANIRVLALVYQV